MRKMLWVVLAVAGCGANPAGKLAKPPTLAKACTPAARSAAEPLLVEWASADRGRLESLSRKGLVAVRYDGCSIEIVPNCTITGAYGFSPTTMKRDHVRIKDADQLYAAVPLGAAKLAGKLQTSGELNADMTSVGRYEADRAGVRADELPASCSGATHVVTALTVGAFKFVAGASAEASAEVGVFGAGAGGGTSHSEEVLAEDGDQSKCASAKADAKAPPAACGALIRMELLALGESKLCPPKTSWDGKRCSNKDACPRGTVRDYGVCSPNGVKYDLPPACEENDPAGCQSACDGGNMNACGEMGWRYFEGVGVTKDDAKYIALSRKACDAQIGRACGNLANGYVHGTAGLTQDAQKAHSLFVRGCELGNAVACGVAADTLQRGGAIEKDLAASVAFRKKACDLGYARGCEQYGEDLDRGRAGTVDVEAAFKAYSRGCSLGSPLACFSVGWNYDYGKGTPANAQTALSYFHTACESGVPRGCAFEARAYALGEGYVEDLDKAYALAMMACNGTSYDGCAIAGLLLTRGEGTAKDEPRGVSLIRRACDSGAAYACRMLSKLHRDGAHGVTKDASAAFALAKRACDDGDDEGCGLAGNALEHGLGVAKDLAKAKVAYTRGCKGGDSASCKALEHLGK